MQLRLKNNTFLLLEQKAIWWEEERTLLISDLHIGKVTHFRKAGIAIPQQAAEENFDRLNQLMRSHDVKCIVFVGDLFHSDINSEWDRFCAWRNEYSEVDMILILGNHDRFPIEKYKEVCLTVYEQELRIGAFTFSHHPKPLAEAHEYVISGHIHPVVKLKGLANQRLKFPCFYFGEQQALLPSFGEFTGGYNIELTDQDQVIAVVEDKLIRIQ
jgi:DNA ligase-associated metallophosphoesterase